MKKLLILALLTVVPTFLHAEENVDEQTMRGRLPDGRAFRTDAEGNQLVDYLAELELGVEALTRQVHGLEGELKDKQTEIERLKSSKNTELSEKTLVAAKQAEMSEEQLKSCSEKEIRCGKDLAATRQSLEVALADLEIERQVGGKKTQDVEQSLEELKASLEEREEALEGLRAQIVRMENDEQSISQELAESRKQLESSRKIFIADAPAVESPEAVQVRASLSSVRLRAVEAVKGKMRTELNQLRGLIQARDSMYAKFSTKKRSVAFKPSPAKSLSNRGMQEIAELLDSAQTVSELSPLRKDISEIERKINDDIALMKRLAD